MELLMAYLHRGQYRYVEYTDDGCTRYQCLWCKSMMEIRDDPTYWHFCPRCGKSWFNSADCRPREIPRWAWDRGHREWQWGLHPERREDPQVWFIECRSKWGDDPWSEWKNEQKVYGNCWQSARQQLSMLRGRHDDRDDDWVKFEYRAITRREQ
jgi:hypothetical protein